MIVRPILCRAFIGRREELAFLRERRLKASSSHGGLIMIAGDAGVGKSRLIAEFSASLAYSRWRIGSGPCLEHTSRPYGPILDVLARVDATPFDMGGAATRQEQFDAIVARFAAIAARTALLVVIEDLHWADAATLDLLSYLGTKLQRTRMLILATFRPDALHPDHPASAAIARIEHNARPGRIDLAPLRGRDLRAFIEEALGDVALPDETQRAIAIAGDGNPFFTEELLKSAVERSTAYSDDRARGALPQTVRATLLERLRPFDENERRIVTQAAVIGRTFSLELLATTLETEPRRLLPTMRRARDFQLVEEVTPAVFRFRHGLTREAIYGDFLGAELRPRHRTIALALESAPADERSIEALAYHWWAAGDGPKAAHYNELAGDAAAAVYAHEDAIAFYERALEARDLELTARGSIVQKIAERRISAGSTAEGQATYVAAADIFREAAAYEREASCRATAAITAYTIGLPKPTAPLEAMLERLDPAEYIARARVHLGLAWLAATFWFPSRAAHHLEQVDSRALAAAGEIGLRFHNVSAWVAMTIGDIEGFRREHAAWVDAARAVSDRLAAGALNNGAMCFTFFGLHEEAQANLDEAFRIARASRNRHAEETAHAFGSMCYYMRGDLERARASVEAVSPTTENRVNAMFSAAWGTLIGAALEDAGLIEKWFDGFEAAVFPAPEIECGAGFGEIMARRGRHQDAAKVLRRAMPDCELVRGNVPTLLAAGRLGSTTDRARARDYLARAAEGPADLLERPALALFDAEALRREGRPDEAITLARDAADGFRRLRIPLLEAAALEVAGDVAAALAIFRRCGALYDVRRLGGARPAEHVLLSAREREIATLAAEGRTNLEIAGVLSISHKTVEKHLGSLYQKLGVSSRRELGPLLKL